MEEKDKIPLVKEAESISKLSKGPVEVSVGLYDISDDLDSLEKKGEVKAYLHRLTWLERNHVRASNTEVYKFWINNGGDKETARDAVMSVIPRMTVYFALKIDSKANSSRFFETQDILMAYPFEEGLYELYKRYVQEFDLTGTEWGNLLRARSLGTSSALPATSQVLIPSEPILRN